ncbi:MAG: GNAT family N-acetyltransferase [Anaerolineales bacterium]
MKTEFLPFTEKMIPEAGRLLAQRHKHNRTIQPLLPARFEDEGVSTKAVEALWQKKLKSGYAAFRNGKMIAYLIGEFLVQPWGRCGYVYLPGYALAESESTNILQDLYALLGEGWVKNGVFSHNLYISATDAHIVNAFFSLGFGKERVDALMDLRSLAIPTIESPSGISIRRTGTGDNEYLGGLSDVIFRALANPPYWHPTVPEDWDELHEGWSELADDKEWTVWLALENNKALGTVGFRPEEEEATSILVSPKTVYLSVAATKPEARGRGVSTFLTWQGLKQSQEDGYQICYTNWISSNLLASRFWPRFGFKDVAYRLTKKINPMISWTRTEEKTG